MRLFFDTEFTGLFKDTSLISIGIVSERGDKFYAEFTDYDKSQVTPWIKENVIDNLFIINDPKKSMYTESIIDGDKKSIYMGGDRVSVFEKLVEWLEYLKPYMVSDTFQFVSDVAHYDFVLLIDLFGNAFELSKYNISPVCIDINHMIAKLLKIGEAKAFDVCREDLLDSHISGSKHNSLYDAEVIKEIFDKVYTVI